MKLGRTQELKIVRKKQFGVYLADPADTEGAEAVLLPAKQVPEGAEPGDMVEVFLYKDSSDRPIATTVRPSVEAGETGKMLVKDVTKIGAFVSIGLEKDILLPFREMEGAVSKGQTVLAALYEDKSGRLAATMRVYPYLKTGAPYKKDDEVTGTVYEVRPMGIFTAVDDRYFGLIPVSEVYGTYEVGQTVECRVMRVREDGKLDLSPRKKAFRQMEDDADAILSRLEAAGGRLPYGDRTDPEEIRKEFGVSKAAFKRAVGRLLKEKKIILTEDGTIQRA